MIKFKKYDEELYYYDTKKLDEHELPADFVFANLFTETKQLKQLAWLM